jgi:telomere length regulation protein
MGRVTRKRMRMTTCSPIPSRTLTQRTQKRMPQMLSGRKIRLQCMSLRPAYPDHKPSLTGQYPTRYIRDLLSMLRDTESYDRQQLSLASAASLIRRKATFGKELSDHVIDLTSHLVGMHDKFDMSNFQEMRMQALIALVATLPETVGPLLAKLFFEGDYSMGQRAGILSALGMGARELAGFKDDDLPLSIESAKGMSSSELFPSKRLPKKAEAAWQKGKEPPMPLEGIVGGLEELMIRSMTAEAADRFTGPKVLKVRAFSSKIEVEKKRTRPRENTLDKVVATGFFFPLSGRWYAASKD